MAGRQIKFPEKQTHNRQFEMAVLALSILCIIFVLIAINVVAGGSFE